MVTVTEAARATGLTRMTLWRYRANGDLPSTTKGRSVLVELDTVRAVYRAKIQANPVHRAKLRQATENGVILI